MPTINLKKFDCYRMSFSKPKIARQNFTQALLNGFNNGDNCTVSVSARNGETLTIKTKCVRTYVERMIR